MTSGTGKRRAATLAEMMLTLAIVSLVLALAWFRWNAISHHSPTAGFSKDFQADGR